MLELKLYRHKKYKDIYLFRIPGITDKNGKTYWYSTTNNALDAIRNFMNYGDNFFAYVDNDANKSIKTIITKYIDDDGYTGTLKKEEDLLISDFELVFLKEAVIDECK